jgi:hypothetical protein
VHPAQARGVDSLRTSDDRIGIHDSPDWLLHPLWLSVISLPAASSSLPRNGLSPPSQHSSPYLFTISSLSCWIRLGRLGDTLPMMGGAFTVLALVVVLLLTAAEFSFALYAFRSGPPNVSYLSLSSLHSLRPSSLCT